jgi:ferritin
MLSKKILAALTEQIKNELYSEYYYLAMSDYCDSIDLPGMANFFLVKSAEERSHAMKIYGYVHDRDERVILQSIPQPKSDFSNIKEVFENMLEHEQFVTRSIHDIYALAVKENDYATQVQMQWFIEEQVEEEKEAKDYLQKVNMAGTNTGALLMLDERMSAVQPGSEE